MTYLIEGNLKSGSTIYFQGYTDCEDGERKASFVFDAAAADIFGTRRGAQDMLEEHYLNLEGFKVKEHLFED
jgi:hypothetical protein